MKQFVSTISSNIGVSQTPLVCKNSAHRFSLAELNRAEDQDDSRNPEYLCALQHSRRRIIHSLPTLTVIIGVWLPLIHMYGINISIRLVSPISR